MRNRVAGALLALLLSLTLAVPAGAATLEEINQTSVLLKQRERGTCTLAATAMMLRRAAYLNGRADWAQITEATCRQGFWRAGVGLPYQFTFQGMSVSRAKLPGGQANRGVLIDLLRDHPEGIMLHAPSIPHGILLTQYKDGRFYCADPSEYAPGGIIPIEEAWGSRIENSTQYWAVTTPVADPTPVSLTPAIRDGVEELMA